MEGRVEAVRFHCSMARCAGSTHCGPFSWKFPHHSTRPSKDRQMSRDGATPSERARSKRSMSSASATSAMSAGPTRSNCQESFSSIFAAELLPRLSRVSNPVFRHHGGTARNGPNSARGEGASSMDSRCVPARRACLSRSLRVAGNPDPFSHSIWALE